MTNFKLSRTSDWFSVVSPQTFDAGCIPLVPLNKTSKLMIPFVGRIVRNNGIQGYDPRSDRYVDLKFEFGNDKSGTYSSISISQVGNQRAFYQPNPWIGSQNMFCLKPLSFSMNHYVGLYFCAIFNSQLKAYSGGYSSYPVKSDIENWKIKVPLTSDGQLDVQYMEQYIKRIEAQYIKRIEAQYIKRIEAYLSVLGYDSIDDCELSSQDLKVLSGPDEWGEFKIGNLFDEIQIGRKYVRNELSPRGQTPVYSSVEENGGILGYINNQAEFELDVSHPYIVFGDHTRTMQIPDNDFSVADNVKVLRGKHAYSVKQLLYIMTCFKKVIPNLGYSRHWTTAKELSFYLPVYGDGSIAYDYMDCYITAVEKKKVLLLKQHLDKRLDLYQRAIKK